jgi:hypothetical protein
MAVSEYSHRYVAVDREYLLNEAACLSKLSPSLLRNIELSQKAKSRGVTGTSEYRVAYTPYENDAYTKVYANSSSYPLDSRDHLFIDNRFPVSDISEYTFRFNPQRLTNASSYTKIDENRRRSSN